MNKFILWAALIGLSTSTLAMTLDEALELAAGQSPELRAARAETAAAEAEIQSSALWENPELELEAEGIGGDNSGIDSAEYTALLAQTVPVFGKKRIERRIAGTAAEAARFGELQTGLEFELRVREAFVDVQAEEKSAAVRSEQVDLATDFLETAQKRYEAGAAAEIEVLRAEMQLEESRLAFQAAENRLQAARNQLARLLGLPEIEPLEGDFFQPLDRAIEQIPEKLNAESSNPFIQYGRAVEDQAAAEAELARRSRIPDLTLAAGARYEEEGHGQTWLFGASIPLPLWNRGRAEILSAGLAAEAAGAQRDLVHRELEQELETLRTEFENAVMEASRCREELLPKAERTIELGREQYKAGRTGWLEQIELQQMLADLRLRAVESQHTAWNAYIQLLKFREETHQ